MTAHADDEQRRRVMFSYWGRRGALSQFTIETARAARASPNLDASISVSRQNEAFDNFRVFGASLHAIDTFGHGSGAVLHSWRIPLVRHNLLQRLAADRTEAVIELLPHVWSPLVMGAVRRAGLRYVPIIHDAVGHPGDRTGLANGWLLRSCKFADRIITLSRVVTDQLVYEGRVPPSRITTLFHPNLSYGPETVAMPRRPDEPLRLLFLGRIMPYKGLSLFAGMIERLRAGGIAVEAGVFGSGDMGGERARFDRLGAEVVNRWLNEADIARALARYHAVVVSHVEASQSGVVAAAHGAGLPAIVTPVGGLIEQVRHCVNGMVAERADAKSLADAVVLLAADPRLYDAIVKNIAIERPQRSMTAFVAAAVTAALSR